MVKSGASLEGRPSRGALAPVESQLSQTSLQRRAGRLKGRPAEPTMSMLSKSGARLAVSSVGDPALETSRQRFIATGRGRGNGFSATLADALGDQRRPAGDLRKTALAFLGACRPPTRCRCFRGTHAACRHTNVIKPLDLSAPPFFVPLDIAWIRSAGKMFEKGGWVREGGDEKPISSCPHRVCRVVLLPAEPPGDAALKEKVLRVFILHGNARSDQLERFTIEHDASSE